MNLFSNRESTTRSTISLQFFPSHYDRGKGKGFRLQGKVLALQDCIPSIPLGVGIVAGRAGCSSRLPGI